METAGLFEEARYPCLELDEEFAPVRLNAAAAGRFVSPDSLRSLLTQEELAALQAGIPVQRPWHHTADRQELLQILPVKGGYTAVITPLTGAADGYRRSLEQMIHEMQGLFAALPALQYFLTDTPQSTQMMEYVLRQGYCVLRELLDHRWCDRLTAAQPLNLQTLDLNELLEALCFAIRSAMPEITLHYTPCDAPVFVQADRELLELIFTHIVRNGVQYAADGCIITVTLQRLKNRAVIHVNDNGTGMQPQIAAHVFEPYFSRDPYDDGGCAPGSGLGLYLAKLGLRALGGEIAMETEYGSGTQTSFTLPLVESPSPEVHATATDYMMDRLSCVQLQFCPLGARMRL